MEGGRTNETRETVNAMRKVYARSNDEMVERQELNLSERPHLLIDRLKKKQKQKTEKRIQCLTTISMSSLEALGWPLMPHFNAVAVIVSAVTHHATPNYALKWDFVKFVGIWFGSRQEHRFFFPPYNNSHKRLKIWSPLSLSCVIRAPMH